jgi:glycosyltransferase involved in cell wall biosynthesis
MMTGAVENRRLSAGNGHHAPRLRPLRVALLAPPVLPVPPPRYGGIERVVGLLAEGLQRHGHDVTVFAAGDSRVQCRLVPVIPRSLWATDQEDDAAPYMQLIAASAAAHADEFDIIHSHIEWHGFLFARQARVPVVSTLHGRLDHGPTSDLLNEFRELPLISISHGQRRWHPHNNWLATIYNAIAPTSLVGEGRGGYLCFVGRITPEKGVAEAIEIARRSGLPLRVAAKVRHPGERALYEEIVRPAEAEGIVEFLGELGASDRDELYAGALATIMLGGWPEPFGLVAAESMAVGTPVIARRAGALIETVRDGIDGFIVDDVDEALLALRRLDELDRAPIRASARDRFSVERMVERHEAAYRRLLGRQSKPHVLPVVATPAAAEAVANS